MKHGVDCPLVGECQSICHWGLVIGAGTGNLARCQVGYFQVGVRVGFFPPGHYPYPKPRYRQVFSFFFHYKSVQIRNCKSFKESWF